MTSPPDPRGLFENLQREHPFEAVEVTGELPHDLRGTLYHNGLGLLELYGERYSHLFEGDGAISALRFDSDGASAAARIIESEGLRAERQANRRLQGAKNTANTHIVPWQSGLYALMEGGKPTAIDPDSLNVLGETDLGGVVQGSFSAHPHRVAARRALYNFGMSYGPQTTIDLYELPDAGRARLMGRVPLRQPVMLHDFTATEKHLVFFVSPLQVVIERIMQGASFTDALAWNPGAGTEVIVVPIDAPDAPIRFETSAFFQFHFAAAFEDRGDIVVDYIHYKDASLLGALGNGRGISFRDETRHVGGSLHRARIDTKARTFRTEPRWDGHCEFPRTASRTMGARHEHVWVQSEVWRAGLLHFGISRIDAQGKAHQHLLQPGEHVSEPVLAQTAEQGETGGSVIALVYDSHTDRSHAIVLDAHTLDLQARIQLSQPIPLRFHGSWLQAAV